MTCIFCSKITKWGIIYQNQHLVGGFRNAKSCCNYPQHVKNETRVFLKELKDWINETPPDNIDEVDDFDMMIFYGLDNLDHQKDIIHQNQMPLVKV